MAEPACHTCFAPARWRRPSPLLQGNVAIVRACDDHARGPGWLRAYSQTAPRTAGNATPRPEVTSMPPTTAPTPRIAWLATARQLASRLAAVAYAEPDIGKRRTLLRLPLRELTRPWVLQAGPLGDPSWADHPVLLELVAHLERPPRGFPSYTGIMTHTALMDFPDTLDSLQHHDTEAQP